MSEDKAKTIKKDNEWKQNPKVTMRFTKNENDGWVSNDKVTMTIEETVPQEHEIDSGNEWKPNPKVVHSQTASKEDEKNQQSE